MKTLLALPLLAFLLNASSITVKTPIPVTGHGELFSGIPFLAPYYVIAFSGTDSTDSISFCCDTGSIDAVAGVAGAHETEGDSFTVDGVTSSMFVTVSMTDSEIFGVESYDPVNPTSVIASVAVVGYFTNQVTTPICSGPLGCNGSETTFDISPTPVLAPEAPTVFDWFVSSLIWVCGRTGRGLGGPRQNLRP